MLYYYHSFSWPRKFTFSNRQRALDDNICSETHTQKEGSKCDLRENEDRGGTENVKPMGDKAKHREGLGRWLSWSASNRSLDLQYTYEIQPWHSRSSPSHAWACLQHIHCACLQYPYPPTEQPQCMDAPYICAHLQHTHVPIPPTE